jgi:hypothetical protein
MFSFTGKNNRKFSHLNFQKTGITSWPPGVDGGLVAASLATPYSSQLLCNARLIVLTLKKEPTKECIFLTFKVNPGSTQLI